MENRIIFYTQQGAIINATNFSTISIENDKLLLDNYYILGYYEVDELEEILQWLVTELGKTRKTREPLVFMMPKSEQEFKRKDDVVDEVTDNETD